MTSSLSFLAPPPQHLRFQIHDLSAFRTATERDYRDVVYRSPILLIHEPVGLPGASVEPCGWESHTHMISGVVLCALEACLVPHEKGEDPSKAEGDRRAALAMRAIATWGPVPYAEGQRRTFVRLAAHLGFGVGVPEQALVAGLAYHAGADIAPSEVHDVYTIGSPFFAWAETRLERENAPEEAPAVVPPLPQADPKACAAVRDAMARRRGRATTA